MHDAPLLHGGLIVRIACLFLGLFLIAAAIVAMLESGLGLPPWDVLHVGIARHTPLGIGVANVMVALVVLAAAWSLGQPPGLGTVANALAIGLFVEVLIPIGWISTVSGQDLGTRIALLLVAIPVFGVGTALYIGAGFGAGPRDSLMLAASRRTGVRIAIVRFSMEALVVASGAALGGDVGLGTLLFALTIGPAVEASFWLVLRLGAASPSRPTVEVD